MSIFDLKITKGEWYEWYDSDDAVRISTRTTEAETIVDGCCSCGRTPSIRNKDDIKAIVLVPELLEVAKAAIAMVEMITPEVFAEKGIDEIDEVTKRIEVLEKRCEQKRDVNKYVLGIYKKEPK